MLIDADLRPWLIEVNASPAMARDTPLDCRVKEAMIRDTPAVVDPVAFDRGALDVLADVAQGRSSPATPQLRPRLNHCLSGVAMPRESRVKVRGRGRVATPWAPLMRRLRRSCADTPRKVARFVGNHERLAPGTAVASKCHHQGRDLATRGGAGRKGGELLFTLR